MFGAGTAMPALIIAIVSSHCLVRLGLQTILENEKSGHVVQRYQRMTPDVWLAERRPDLFILDLEAARDTIGTIRQIRESAPNSKIVLLSGGEDQQRLQEAVTCSVDGLILKIQPPVVVLATIEALYAPAPHYARGNRNGAEGVSVDVAAKPMGDSTIQPPKWLDVVTEREREIIRLVGQGLSNKEIAHRLCIADSTVRHHLTNIFDKVGVPNRQKLLVHTHQFCSVHASPP